MEGVELLFSVTAIMGEMSDELMIQMLGRLTTHDGLLTNVRLNVG